jgi:chromosome segregation ATPase
MFDQLGEVPWMHDIGRDASSSYAEDMSDGTWMTYAELAALRRINQASAFKLALRRRWRRQKNNTGQMTVFVPSAWSDTSQDNPADIRTVSALETAVSTLREQLAAANDRADQAESDRRAAEGRADQADADRRAAIALTDQTVALLTDAVARADQAEQGREAARTRADVLRDRIEAMQVDAASLQAQLATAEAEGNSLTVETAELTAQVKAAKTEAREVQERVEELRQADDAARRGRRRLARLRAAWRGE